MNSNRPFPDDVRRIDREAAAWLILRDRGFSAPEQDAFFQWLALDPRHGDWFARHQATWTEFNLLAEWKPEHSAEPNPDLLAKLPRKRRAAMRWAWFGGFAAAASIAMGLVLWLPGDRDETISTHAGSRAPAITNAYERRVLEDGSVVELNRGTKLEIFYTALERRVRLDRGEAAFTVTKNPARPFIVRAGGVDVRAVGTAFNVRFDAKQIHVLVTEGKVRVDDALKGATVLAVTTPGEIPVLTAGQQVTIDVAPTVPTPVMQASTDEITRQLAWRPELLEFSSTPLSQVVEAFNRRNTIQIAVADQALLEMPIVASFRSDNVEGFVRLLELTGGVSAEHVGTRIVLRRVRQQ